MFALFLLSIFKDSLDDVKSRNDKRENKFHTEKQKNLQVLWHCLLCLLQILLALAISKNCLYHLV